MPAESQGQHWPAGSALRQSRCPGASVIGTFFPFCTIRLPAPQPGGRPPPLPGRRHLCTSLQSVNSSDWASIASLATAGGMLVLAVATFAAVRSANRAARAAEQSLLVGLRPLLMPSRLQDETQKVMFGDGRWLQIPGGRATLQAEDKVIYLTMSLRNVGDDVWLLPSGRRWNVDRPDPR